jgi:hypothetical protein
MDKQEEIKKLREEVKILHEAVNHINQIVDTKSREVCKLEVELEAEKPKTLSVYDMPLEKRFWGIMNGFEYCKLDIGNKKIVINKTKNREAHFVHNDAFFLVTLTDPNA